MNDIIKSPSLCISQIKQALLEIKKLNEIRALPTCLIAILKCFGLNIFTYFIPPLSPFNNISENFRKFPDKFKSVFLPLNLNNFFGHRIVNTEISITLKVSHFLFTARNQERVTIITMSVAI